MGLVIAGSRLPALLKPVIGYLKTLTIHLFRNNHIPTRQDTVSDYTEADFDGYVPHELPSWGLPFTNSAGNGEVTHPNIHFFCNGATVANSIYGYYVTDELAELVWAEINPGGPVTIGMPGDVYVVAPTFTAFQC